MRKLSEATLFFGNCEADRLWQIFYESAASNHVDPKLLSDLRINHFFDDYVTRFHLEVAEPLVREEIRDQHNALIAALESSDAFQAYAQHVKNINPENLFRATITCLQRELVFLREVWIGKARNSIQQCTNIHQRLSESFQPDDLQLLGGFTVNAFSLDPNHQFHQLLEEFVTSVGHLSQFVETCVEVLLQYISQPHPSKFVLPRTEKKISDLSSRYRVHLKILDEIKTILNEIISQHDLWAYHADVIRDCMIRIAQLNDRTDVVLNTVISTQSMVISQQPNPAIKQKSLFKMELQISFDSAFPFTGLNKIRVSIINPSQASQLHEEEVLLEEIKNGCGEMLFPDRSKEKLVDQSCSADRSTNILRIPFDNLTILDRPKDEPRPKSVLKQKFYALFFTEVETHGVKRWLWACSNPFVYTTNTSQQSMAMSTIFWDCVLYKTPFSTCNTANVKDVRAALVRYISQVTPGLLWTPSDDNLDYLIHKILQYPEGGSTPKTIISRSQIDEDDDREIIKDKNAGSCTFWKWFDGSLTIMSWDNFKRHWTKGHIIGFIHRDKAEAVVDDFSSKAKQPGSFLIRFAGSVVGGISVTWNHPQTGETVSGVLPLKDKELQNTDIDRLIIETDTLSRLIYRDAYTDTYKEKHKNQDAFAHVGFQQRDSSVVPSMPGKKPYAEAIMMLQFRLHAFIPSEPAPCYPFPGMSATPQPPQTNYTTKL